jgi:glycosyltransferase involved in cell wall biosynthesis
MPSLGFSIFVKDEMVALPDLIQSITPHFSDIVVLDTGSTDGTWEWLREQERAGTLRPYRIGIPFNAKNFHYGYVRSMAAHLNRGEWVMMLDADERMREADLLALGTVVGKAHVGGFLCITFPRNNWNDAPDVEKSRDGQSGAAYPDRQTRCIRNNKKVWWRRAVHEVIMMGPDKDGVPRVDCNLHIQHYHVHFKGLKSDDGSFHKVYDELTKADPDWIGTF